MKTKGLLRIVVLFFCVIGFSAQRKYLVGKF